MSDLKFELHGAKEANEILKSLNAKDRIEIYYRLNRKGANEVKKQLQAAAPSSSIAKGVAIVRSKINKTAVLIGFLKKAFYVRFKEFGTEIRSTKGKGKYKKEANRGQMKPEPFVQGAHDAAVSELQIKLGQNYLKELNKILKAKIKSVNKKISKMK